MKNRLNQTSLLHIWKCCRNLAPQLCALSDVLCSSYGSISIPTAADARAASKLPKLLQQRSPLPRWPGRAQSKPREEDLHRSCP